MSSSPPVSQPAAERQRLLDQPLAEVLRAWRALEAADEPV
jgi:hypothetical protein